MKKGKYKRKQIKTMLTTEMLLLKFKKGGENTEDKDKLIRYRVIRYG